MTNTLFNLLALARSSSVASRANQNLNLASIDQAKATLGFHSGLQL